MFGVGFSEVVVIFALTLIVLGPEKLPKLAATIGRWLGRARAMARQFREQLDTETTTLRQSMDEATRDLSSHADDAPPPASATPPPASDTTATITQAESAPKP
jgi:sec-independent protein translocase protein TatB